MQLRLQAYRLTHTGVDSSEKESESDSERERVKFVVKWNLKPFKISKCATNIHYYTHRSTRRIVQMNLIIHSG